MKNLHENTENSRPTNKRHKSKLKKKNCHYGPTNSIKIDSPIGEMEIISCPNGLHAVGQAQDISDENFSPNPKTEVRHISQKWEDNGYKFKPVITCIEWLREYFENPENINALQKPPICPSVLPADDQSTFQQKVWRKLYTCTSTGDSISYGQLGKLVNGSNSRVGQAVGTAMKMNPIQLIIPCHRVIKSDGSFGSYHGGERNVVKAWLIQHEAYVKYRNCKMV